MAGRTIRRELRRRVVGVGRLVVIGRVAARTGVGGVAVIAVVTGRTIVGNGGMRPGQRIVVVVNGKSGRFPAGGGVATRAIRRNGERYVLRIRTLVVVRCVAARTIRGRTGISGSMTIQTSGGLVRSGQRETGVVVIKSGIAVAGWVTSQASRTVVRIAIDTGVLIVGFRVEVAGDAGKFRIIGRVGMAIDTLIPLSLVGAAVNREIGGIVLQVGGRCPIRIGGVALRAILREIGQRVVRNQRGFKVIFVAGYTIGRGI